MREIRRCEKYGKRCAGNANGNNRGDAAVVMGDSAVKVVYR
jgi:hypothetical protein